MPVCHDRLEAYLPAQQSSEALALQAFVRQFHFVPKTFFITTRFARTME
jgi:hypothetical protein